MVKAAPRKSDLGVRTRKNNSARQHNPNQTIGGVHRKLTRNIKQTPKTLPSKFSP